MNGNEPVMNTPHDHIMANTWRLIFDRRARLTGPAAPSRPAATDFAELEELLYEYRLIGLALAGRTSPQRYD